MSHRILVVDDDESIRFTFSEFLTDAGYLVDTAESVEKATACFEANEYDAIFLDILLGRESGIDVLKAARELNPNCQVTMVTGAPEIKTAAAAVRHGAFDYLTKPINQEDLLRQAERAVAYKTAIDQKERYQKRMAAVFQGVKEGILVFDVALKLIDINFSAQEMLNCGEEVLGKELNTLIGESNNKTLKALQEVLESRVEGEFYKLQVEAPDGRQSDLSVSISPLTSAKGMDADLVLVLRDETVPGTIVSSS
ncbi:MAG: response regulator [Desulfuromonadales bacterium]|nr:response regulator [Desulfuromonadales bacterium]